MRGNATVDGIVPTESKREWLIVTVAVIVLIGVALLFVTVWNGKANDSEHAASQSFGPIDIGFAQSMAQHHDQAILMSQIMMAKPASGLGRLATAIQTKQLIEVGHMQAWLRLADQPLLPRSSEMDWMLLGSAPLDPSLTEYLAACRASGGAMPGMASSDELNVLREQQGDEADRLFLDMMIKHHAGSLPMTEFASKYAETLQVRALASSMRFEQDREIHYLRGLLSSKFLQGP